MLYTAWQGGSEGERYDNNYLQLFIQAEKHLINEMKKDRADNHARSERGWTPPPKGYADEFGEE